MTALLLPLSNTISMPLMGQNYLEDSCQRILGNIVNRGFCDIAQDVEKRN